ncbi:MAG: carboxypeptidase regulatory-like domain-containing protein, partial [Spirochaetales bacterium]|nr:carboxypeptidase regulatory-like domain-containing protein [Candidatus Physcosoma equi]
VPQGNYSGVRFSREDFRDTSVSKTIALIANDYVSFDDAELKATHNYIYGTVDVLTTDDESSVTITFDGVDSIAEVVTDATGAFRFEHVPVGEYTIRFQRHDCSDITVVKTIGASDGYDLGTVTVTPNTATIKGKVNLDKGTSLSGVTVSVDMGDGKVLSTTTNSSGRYEIGGVSIADEYTVTYSKDGWVSANQSISPKLGLLEVRELDEVTLVDTTAPVFSKIVINSGSNTAADKEVVLHFTASDNGSGLAKIMVNHTGIFDPTDMKYDYAADIQWTLLPANGVKTVYAMVIDAAGNTSNVVSATVTLTDQKKEVRGVLSGDDLHWTKAMSPYLVTGNLMVEDGDTLTIDPGVDVQFSGAYYLQVEGALDAVGTEEEQISLYGIGEGVNKWKGVNCVRDNGSFIQYAKMTDMNEGVSGYVKVKDSVLESNGYVLGNGSKYFYGSLEDSTGVGRIYTSGAAFHFSILNLGASTSRVEHSLMSGTSFAGSDSLALVESVAENTNFTDLTVSHDSSGSRNSTYFNCMISIKNGGLFYLDTFDGCKFLGFGRSGAFKPAKINSSNIISCEKITVDTDRTTYELVDLTGNFWGAANTRELNTKGVNTNLSFLDDYYDDFNRTMADLSVYVTTLIEEAF